MPRQQPPVSGIRYQVSEKLNLKYRKYGSKRSRHATALPFHDQQGRPEMSDKKILRLFKGRGVLQKGPTFDGIFPHRNDFEKCFGRSSADLA